MKGKNIKKYIKGVTFILFPIFLFSQQREWVYTYNGQANGNDVCHDIVYGGDGNIYAVGTKLSSPYNPDWLVVSLTGSGNLRWLTAPGTPEPDGCGPISVAYGEDNNIYVAGTMWDYPATAVFSYTSQGQYRWDGGVGGYVDETGRVIWGRDGNIYVASGTSNPNNYLRYFGVASWTSGGQYRWWYMYTNYGESKATDIVMDENYNLYAVGFSSDPALLMVVSLTNTGAFRWIYTRSGSGNSIAYGNDGNLYVAGNNVILSLNLNGQLRWEYTSNRNFGWIIYGGDDNLYAVAGGTVLSLTNQGTQRWIYSHPNSSFSRIIQGPDGNLYVCGSINGDMGVIKLNAINGELIWECSYNGVGNGNDGALSIAIDAQGGIYVGGYSYGSGTQNDFTVMKVLDLYLGEKDYTFPSDNDDSKISSIYLMVPTFFGNGILVKVLNPFTRNLRFSISDVSGKEVFSKVYPVSPMIRIYDEKLEKLPQGIYFLKVYSGKEEVGKFKLIKK